MISSCGVLTVLPLVFNTDTALTYPEDSTSPLVAYTPLSPTSGTLTFRVATDTPPGDVHIALTAFSGPNDELNIVNVKSRTIGPGGDNIVFTILFSPTTPAFELLAVSTTEPCCQGGEGCGR